MNNFRIRDFYVIEWCYMFRMDGEIIDLLFFHCDVARLLWNDILTSQHMDWVLSRHMEDMLNAWRRKYGTLFQVASYGVRGERERNSCYFVDQTRTT